VVTPQMAIFVEVVNTDDRDRRLRRAFHALFAEPMFEAPLRRVRSPPWG
jgi:hypothetical protein